MRTLNRLLVVAAMALLIAAPGVAGVVFQAGFEAAEGYTLGGGIHGKPATSPNWNVQDGEDALVVADPAGGGNQCTKWVGDWSGGPDATDNAIDFTGLGTTKDLQIRQMCYAPANNPTSRELVFTSGAFGVRMSFGGGYYTGYHGGPVWKAGSSVSSVLTKDAWHEAVLTVHYAASTYDFVVDGVPVATGVACTPGALSRYNPWSEDEDGTGRGAIYYDNLLISQLDPEVIPEPSAIGLFGLAGLSLLARRRR